MDNYKDKKLWDIVVRVFHWSLVIMVFIAFLSSEENESIHIKVGYVILGLVILRIIWGFVGTKHARFTDFVKGPKKVLAYLKGLFTGNPPYYIGHNPAGGLMIVAILVTLLCVAFTGIKTEQGERAEHASKEVATSSGFSIVSTAYADDKRFERDGDDGYSDKGNSVLAAGSLMASKRGGKDATHEMWEEAHEIFAGLLLVLIAIHVAAVLMTWIVYKENLIKSMITGRKVASIMPHR
jgi:cytochrome b